MPPPLWTIRKIADELGIPESTVRNYRDQFEQYVPAIGRARRRRYADEAVTVLRFIAEAYAGGQHREDIAAALADMDMLGPQVPEARPAGTLPALRDPAVSTALEQLMANETQRQEVLWQIAQQVSRLGEALEHQQATLADIVTRFENDSRSFPPPPTVERRAQPPVSVHEDLAALRGELDTERELVERLRRAKLELERQLVRSREAPPAPPKRPQGVIARILGRDHPE